MVHNCPAFCYEYSLYNDPESIKSFQGMSPEEMLSPGIS
jgi:hypothetical protein